MSRITDRTTISVKEMARVCQYEEGKMYICVPTNAYFFSSFSSPSSQQLLQRYPLSPS